MKITSRSVPGLAKVRAPAKRELSIPIELREREQLMGGTHVMRRDGLIVCPEKRYTQEAREARK